MMMNEHIDTVNLSLDKYNQMRDKITKLEEALSSKDFELRFTTALLSKLNISEKMIDNCYLDTARIEYHDDKSINKRTFNIQFDVNLKDFMEA